LALGFGVYIVKDAIRLENIEKLMVFKCVRILIVTVMLYLTRGDGHKFKASTKTIQRYQNVKRYILNLNNVGYLKGGEVVRSLP
jgi:hypothetical protein